jgi:site-specific recombinase XerD
MKKNRDLLQALTDFFNGYLPSTKGLSINTIDSYQCAFQLLFEYLYLKKGLLPEKVTFQSLTGGAVADFLNWLESGRKCSVKTRNQRLAAISSFSKYTLRQNFSGALPFYTEVSAIPKKKVPKNENVIYFTVEEIGLLLRSPKTSTTIGSRDAVLMSVLYASGARAQEICDLTINDVNFGEKTTLRLFGKGAKARVVAIPKECASLLMGYLKRNGLYTTAGDEKRKHVFSSQTHEHMTISCVEEIVKKYVASAKLARPDLFLHQSYSPHSFRHSIAVHMLENGVPLPVIKNFLGHSSIESTLVYATVSPELANRYLRENGFGSKIPTIEEPKEKLSNSLPFLSRIGKGVCDSEKLSE